MSLNVVIIGLGSMGLGMARSVIRAHIPTWGFDLSTDRMSILQAEGGRKDSLEKALATADVTISVVVNSQQTEEILFGQNGAAGIMRPGSVFMSCATVAPSFARDMEKKLHSNSIYYLDTPISGGSVRADSGQLSIMASGHAAGFQIAQPALDAMAETVFRLGDEAGAGSALKVINQMLAGIHIAATAEAMTFGIAQGIEPQTIVDVISKCAGTSWMFENRAPHIVSGDYTPHSAVSIFVKDLGIVSDIAQTLKISAPITTTALQQFMAASAAGFGHEDDAAVAKIYARDAGLTLPGDTQ